MPSGTPSDAFSWPKPPESRPRDKWVAPAAAARGMRLGAPEAYGGGMPAATPQPRPHRELLDALADIGQVPEDADPTEAQIARFVAAWDACPPVQGPRRPSPKRRPQAGRESPPASS